MMRTALWLLLLLALASIPGSLLPQRGTSPLKVNEYLQDHPLAGRIFDQLRLFDVFASPWFAAVYLLLFISLTGCVVPRTFELARELRKPPTVAPTNFKRLPTYRSWHSDVDPQDAIQIVAKQWRASGWRICTTSDSVSAERGYLRETGNLLFHLALLAVLVAVGFGGAVGYKGTVIVREGSGFANNVTQYDTFTPGRLFQSQWLTPFSFTLKEFTATFQQGGQQNGAARMFRADLQVRKSPDAKSTPVRVMVNEPLRVAGATVYLVGHGYAPQFTVRNSVGEVIWQDAAVFLPEDGNFTSTGVVKIPDATPQIGLQGFFLPTTTTALSMGPRSTFPAAKDPQVFLSAWSGDLGLDQGKPQSVYRLDTSKMKRIGIEELKPGQVWKLPDGNGSVSFDGFRQWASFAIARDPGKGWALLAGIFAIAGLTLSLLVPRRRVWLRIAQLQDGSSLIELAGLSKTETPGFIEEIERMAVAIPGNVREVDRVS